MPVTTFDELAQYALRKCSEGVNKVNITDSQLSDRIEEAIEYYGQFHGEARQRNYISHKVTGSHLQLTTNVAQNFQVGEIITGATSGATLKVYDRPEINKVRTREINGTFIVGETINGEPTKSNQSAIIATNGIFIGDIQNGYITLPDNIISVLRTLPAGTGIGYGNGGYIFDIQYQLTYRALINNATLDLFDYYLMQQQLSLIDMIFGSTAPTIPFNRILGRLQFSVNNYDIDSYIVLEVYQNLANGSSSDARIFNDFWIKKYATALVKRQWAENLGKYQNVILPGGITVNSGELYEQATAEIEKWEKIMETTFQEPLGMFIG